MSSAKGNVGEFLVMAELLHRDFDAYLGNWNNPAFDVACFWNPTDRGTRLRVKTTHNGEELWSQKKSGALFVDMQSKDDFVCIVNLKDGIRQAEFYIVPTPLINDELVENQRFWESFPKSDGSIRKLGGPCVMRFFGEDRETNRSYGYDAKYAEYRDNWNLLK